MKNIVRIAATLLCAVVMASVSFAAAPAIDFPRGLAVDAKGNLYVANYVGNNILVYNASYVLQASKTITAGISTPWGVAVDRWGNLWVSNNSNNTITEYVGGQLNAAATITLAVSNPQAIAFDAMGDLWVVDNFASIDVYSPAAAFGPPRNLAQTMTFGNTIFGMTVGAAGQLAVGSPSGISVSSASWSLVFGSAQGITDALNNSLAIAGDTKGNLYVANLDGTVDFAVPTQGLSGTGLQIGQLLQLPFEPTGIAIDNARGRIYISNYNGSSVSVYSTAGKLLHVIQ